MTELGLYLVGIVSGIFIGFQIATKSLYVDIQSEFVDKAELICEKNEGLESIRIYINDSPEIFKCSDGVIFEVSGS